MKLCLLSLTLVCAAWPQNSTLSGTVTDAVTHQPLAGAKVAYDHDGAVASAISDTNGSYTIQLAAGTYETFLVVSKPEYASLGPETLDSAFLRVTPGVTEKRDFAITRSAGIHGRITDSDSGAPLAGFSVDAIRMISVGGTSFPLHSPSRTTSDGEFAIADLLPDEYKLQVETPRGGKLLLPDEKSGGRGYTNLSYATPVRLIPGERRRLDLSLAKTELRRIEGSIDAPESMRDTPIWIELCALNGPPVLSGELPKAGPFRMEGLQEGTYNLLISTKKNDVHARAFANARIELGDRNVDDLKLTLRLGVSVKVTASMAEEDVQSPVSLDCMLLSLDGWLIAGEQTKEAKSLRLTELPPGRYLSIFMPPQGRGVVSATWNGIATGIGPIDLQSDAVLAYTLTARPATVIGTVLDRDDRPVPGAEIVLVPEGFIPQPERFAGMALRRTATERDGSFRFRDLGPGRFTLAVSPQVSGETITLERGQTLNVRIHSN